MNIVQFVPYYEPHVWWVEKVASDIHKNWTYWESIVFTSDIWQEEKRLDGKVIIFPAFNLVSNFPFPKFWQKNFWNAFKSLRQYYWGDTRVITHTRFFFSSFLWAYIARKNNIEYIHIEHGSGFVKSWNFLVDICSKIYDKTFWKYCIKNADKVLSISKASRGFVKNEFSRSNVELWYRGIDFPEKILDKKLDENIFVYIGRLVALKQVSDFIQAYKNWNFTQKCIIIWGGEERRSLEKLAEWANIEFLWQKSHNEIIDFLQENRCILVNPSSQEWLPTTVIEGLMTRNIVIATDVWGTNEISDESDLQLFWLGNIKELEKYMRDMTQNYEGNAWKSYNELKKKFSMRKSLEELYNHMK